MKKLGVAPTEVNETGDRATTADFCRTFHDKMWEFYRLSLLLTRDPARAECCFAAAMQDCMCASYVFKDWTESWARRAIALRAIREVSPRPTPCVTDFGHIPTDRFYQACGIASAQLRAVLALQDFERFVVVMSVLERHSDRDCALLLGCSLIKVRETRSSALVQLANRCIASNIQPSLSYGQLETRWASCVTSQPADT